MSRDYLFTLTTLELLLPLLLLLLLLLLLVVVVVVPLLKCHHPDEPTRPSYFHN